MTELATQGIQMGLGERFLRGRPGWWVCRRGAGHCDVNGNGADWGRRGVGQGCWANEEAYIRWAFGWVVRKETGGFTGDGVLGVDKACHGCQVGAYCVEGVPDVVTENLLDLTQ